MAYDVFISYGHQDKLVADAACARLEARGIRCWIAPRDLLAGQSYAEGIATALRQCRALVLVFSASANLSRHVNNEVERAVNNNIPIVPLRIENVSPTGALEYFIGSVHWLDALTPPMEQHLDRLADTLHKLISVGRAPESKATPMPAPPVQAPPNQLPSRRGLYAGLGAAALLVLLGIIWYAAVPGQRTPAPIIAPTARTENPPAVQPPARRTVASPMTAAPPRPAEGLAGCWTYNNFNLQMYPDGQVTGFLEGGRWAHQGGNRYTITWPRFVDTVQLSADGRSLTAASNYGYVIPAQRVSGTQGLAGTWLWSNGITSVDERGNVSTGPFQGRWTALGGDTYRVQWTHFPIDSMVLSADGQTLSGQNQFGFKAGGNRVECAH